MVGREEAGSGTTASVFGGLPTTTVFARLFSVV
jgi:hypothetical protein